MMPLAKLVLAAQTEVYRSKLIWDGRFKYNEYRSDGRTVGGCVVLCYRNITVNIN